MSDGEGVLDMEDGALKWGSRKIEGSTHSAAGELNVPTDWGDVTIDTEANAYEDDRDEIILRLSFENGSQARVNLAPNQAASLADDINTILDELERGES